MKRTALFFLIFILVGWVFVPPAHAAINAIPGAVEFGKTFDSKVNTGSMSKEVYTPNTQALYMDTGTCFIVGCSIDPKSAFYSGKSAVASVGNVILAMYTNPPADLSLWIHSTAQDLGFEPREVHAQGIGFTGLSPLLSIWTMGRNISYGLLAVVMIAIGFMVMFRKKIDPKTVLTVQNALPKIVLALLLITFSYAIAAFLIDLMYLVMAIVINLLVGASNGALGPQTAAKYLGSGLGTLLAALFGGGMSSIDDLMKLLFYNSNAPWWNTLSFVVNAISGVWEAQGVLVSLIVSIILLFGIIRIAFMLVGAYIQIIISVLISPFQLMTEAIPGANSFASWIKNLIANLAVFPVTAAMLLVGTILTQSNAGNLWTPPFLSSSGSQGVAGIIGLGVLMTIPNVANSIKEALKAKAPVNAGVGAIFGPGISGTTGIMNTAYQGSMINSMIRGHGGKPETAEDSPLANIAKEVHELREHMGAGPVG